MVFGAEDGWGCRAPGPAIGSTQTPSIQLRNISSLEAVSFLMLRDLRFAIRLIVKERWFSAAAVVALALGIGVNAVGFTLINAAFLRGLPFDDADRLYMLTWQGRPGRRKVSHVELPEWRERNHTFAGLAAYRNDSMNVSDDRALPEQARGTWSRQFIRPAAATAAARPRVRRRRAIAPCRARHRHQLYVLEESLWCRQERARHAGAREWTRGHNRRCHARGHALSGQYRGVDSGRCGER